MIVDQDTDTEKKRFQEAIEGSKKILFGPHIQAGCSNPGGPQNGSD